MQDDINPYQTKRDYLFKTLLMISTHYSLQRRFATQNLVTLLVLILLLCGSSTKTHAEDLAEAWSKGVTVLESSVLVWPVIRINSGDTMREWKPLGTVFGMPVITVRGMTTRNKLKKIYVQFLDIGQDAPSLELDAKALPIRDKISAALDKESGMAGRMEKPDRSMSPTAWVQHWETPDFYFKTIFEPGKRLWMTIEPVPEDQRAIVASKNLKWRLRLNVRTNISGDIWLAPLPGVEPLQGNDDRTPMANWLAKIHDWKLDSDALSLLLESSRKLPGRDFLKQLAASAKCTQKTLLGFDFAEIQKHINEGIPVIWIRANTNERNAFLSNFASKRNADPSIELPLPTDPDEQKQWPRADPKNYVWICAIVGYNAKRGEITISHPGAEPQYQNLHMRIEEASTSSHGTVFFYLPPILPVSSR